MVDLKHPVLGDLYFDYGWKRLGEIKLKSHVFPITYIFEAFQNESITPQQVESYQYVDAKKDELENRIGTLLQDYIKTEGVQNASVEPQALLFKQGGELGLLCNCSWDIENGIVVILKPIEKVTIQDSFI